MVVEAVVFALPFVAIALAIVYAGYVAYQSAQARERAAVEPRGPDPALELERINTEIARTATQARATLEQARDAMRRGLKG